MAALRAATRGKYVVFGAGGDYCDDVAGTLWGQCVLAGGRVRGEEGRALWFPVLLRSRREKELWWWRWS